MPSNPTDTAAEVRRHVESMEEYAHDTKAAEMLGRYADLIERVEQARKLAAKHWDRSNIDNAHAFDRIEKLLRPAAPTDAGEE